MDMNVQPVCRCGCGQSVTIAKKTVSRLGHVKGQPVFYAAGHGSALPRGESRTMVVDGARCITLPLGKNIEAIIDEAESERYSSFRWFAHIGLAGIPYVTCKIADGLGGFKSHVLHRMILGVPDGRVPIVDHVNGNTLDNRRCNLRIATASQNCTNTRLRKDNTSGFKGVSRTQDGDWLAQIQVQRKKIKLGVFPTPQEAHAAYSQAATKYHGEYVRHGTVSA